MNNKLLPIGLVMALSVAGTVFTGTASAEGEAEYVVAGVFYHSLQACIDGGNTRELCTQVKDNTKTD